MNKLFNLLVLASLPAQACGGDATDVESRGSSTNDPKASSSGTSGATTGVDETDDPPGIGATTSTGSTAGAGSEAPPDECPSEQWSCEGWSCSYPVAEPGELHPWEQPESCVCDLSRPTTEADCEPTEQLVCYMTFSEVAPSERISCSCLPNDPPNASPCREHDWVDGSTYDELLCGCALPVIR